MDLSLESLKAAIARHPWLTTLVVLGLFVRAVPWTEIPFFVGWIALGLSTLRARLALRDALEESGLPEAQQATPFAWTFTWWSIVTLVSQPGPRAHPTVGPLAERWKSHVTAAALAFAAVLVGSAVVEAFGKVRLLL